MTQLPSLSKEFDKYLALTVVDGEVTDKQAHRLVSDLIEEREYLATPPTDLWAFHIVPCLKALARKVNELNDRVCVRGLPLPPQGAGRVVGGFISADGKVPLRMLIMYMPSDEVSNVGRYILTIDTMIQEVV